mmetsp:Transcript_28991/g.56754  ORF Transcript_28991/g.56754 Transcript_28991/m.56754 type:complete len:258 (+) Transcript_28991:1329-2102(+)
MGHLHNLHRHLHGSGDKHGALPVLVFGHFDDMFCDLFLLDLDDLLDRRHSGNLSDLLLHLHHWNLHTPLLELDTGVVDDSFLHDDLWDLHLLLNDIQDVFIDLRVLQLPLDMVSVNETLSHNATILIVQPPVQNPALPFRRNRSRVSQRFFVHGQKICVLLFLWFCLHGLLFFEGKVQILLLCLCLCLFLSQCSVLQTLIELSVHDYLRGNVDALVIGTRQQLHDVLPLRATPLHVHVLGLHCATPSLCTGSLVSHG